MHIMHIYYIFPNHLSSTGENCISYFGNLHNRNFSFTDYDECGENMHTCHSNADCVNTVGSYKCRCRSGYTGNGHQCTGMYILIERSRISMYTSIYAYRKDMDINVQECACLFEEEMLRPAKLHIEICYSEISLQHALF